MHYDYFIGMVMQHETDRVVAYRGQEYRVANEIPNAFVLTVPDIIPILQNNADKFCEPSEKLVLLGMQPAGQMLESHQPKALSRSYDDEHHERHLCCTLDFFICDKLANAKLVPWVRTESLLVDFTLGQIMNGEAFVSRIADLPEQGLVYGDISETSLRLAWKVAQIKKSHD